MRIYEYKKDAIPAAPSVIAIGFFDGVHTAHRALIAQAAKRAKELSLPLGIFTFGSEDGIKSGVARIYTTEQRLSIFESLGVDFCVISRFSDIRGMSAESFCKSTLIGELGCQTCAVGYNFKFGKGASADANTLRLIMAEGGAEVIICEEQKISGITASSSAIRKMLTDGDMRSAATMLGMPYFAQGYVTHGNGIGGKRLGVPTLNIDFAQNALIPRLGVYTASVEVDSKVLPAVLNLGACPTCGERKIHIEVHIFDFSEDLYGKFVKVNFLSFLRDEKRFSSEEELKKQIKADILAAIEENRGAK